MRHTPVLAITILAATALAACTSDRAPEDVPDAVTADPDHYAVAHENDAVRLLRVTYGAGEASSMHSHPAHCFVALDAGSFSMEAPDGSTTALSTILGQVGCVEAGAHRPRNTGDAPTSVILVEFKEGATAPPAAEAAYPDAVTADPEHYSVAHETDVARVLHARYGAGATSVMHHHPAYCFVGLSPSRWRMTDPEGTVTEVEVEPGQLECVDAHAHQPENISGVPAEVVLIELKNRATFGG